MPHVSVIVNHGRGILRFRCYACAEPWWNTLEEVKADIVEVEVPKGKCQTVISLCDNCLERFYKEGRFWIPKTREG